MKKNLEILLIALCLITNYFIKNYLSFIALFFLIILYLFDENRENFKKVLIKLEVINQIYISKEEKLNNVLGQSNLPENCHWNECSFFVFSISLIYC